MPSAAFPAPESRTVIVPNPQLSLGSFLFEGLESPERIIVKKHRRLMVHRLGSGGAIADWLGDDCPLMSFQGIFSGANAINRARTLEELRTDGRPLVLTWDMQSSFVLVRMSS